VRFALLGIIEAIGIRLYELGDFFDPELESFQHCVAIATPVTDATELSAGEDEVKDRRKRQLSSRVLPE
jgi:hypothetical protein